MPGGDRTGPLGRGPMTGRAAGYCAGYSRPGYSNSIGYGRGFGRGLGRRFWRRGIGFGRRYNIPDPYFYPDFSKEDEKIYLEETIKNLEEEINSLRSRIKEISKEKKDKQ